MSEAAPSRPTPAQVLLGLFVMWQLFFLVTKNLLDYVGFNRPLGTPLQVLRDGLGRWERLTGQVQYWKLFSPHVGTTSRFATVELRWDDGRAEQLRSIFEPPESLRYWRVPGWDDRFFNYQENVCTRLHKDWSDDRLDLETKEDQEDRREAVQLNWRPALAYLRWRVARFQEDHPELLPPREIVLLVRLYRPSPPGERPWQWQGPIRQPLVRWRPAVEPPPGMLPLEAYNPVKRQFESVAVKNEQAP